MGDLVLIERLFTGAALICLGFGFALFYEALAFFTRRVPTISGIVAGQLLSHPRWGREGYFAAGLLIGALATHFAN